MTLLTETKPKPVLTAYIPQILLTVCSPFNLFRNEVEIFQLVCTSFGSRIGSDSQLCSSTISAGAEW